MAPILITGITGNVGLPAAQYLLRHGVAVRGATTRVPAVPPAGLEGVAWVRCDFTDPSTWDHALAGVERLFLMRPPHLSDVTTTLLPFLRRAEVLGVNHVVFLSLMGVEQNRVVPHRTVEDHLRASGLGWTMLRAGFFMQNLEGIHGGDLRTDGVIAVPAGRGRTSFVDARDVGEAAARILRAPQPANAACTLTGAQALTYDEVAAIFTRVLGRPIRYTRPGILEFRRRLARSGAPPDLRNVMTMIYTVARLGLADGITPELGDLLGRPPTTMEQYVRDRAAVWAPATNAAPALHATA